MRLNVGAISLLNVLRLARRFILHIAFPRFKRLLTPMLVSFITPLMFSTMKLTDKDYRIILYALTVVANWNGRFALDAAFLADKFRWMKSPITNNKQLLNILNYGKKAY